MKHSNETKTLKSKTLGLALAAFLIPAGIASAHDSRPVVVQSNHSGHVEVVHQLPGGTVTVGADWGRPRPAPQVVVVKESPRVIVVEKGHHNGHHNSHVTVVREAPRRRVVVVRPEPRREVVVVRQAPRRQVVVVRQAPRRQVVVVRQTPRRHVTVIHKAPRQVTVVKTAPARKEVIIVKQAPASNRDRNHEADRNTDRRRT